ncbi:response regulator transcription factor [Shinella zoogloeoides]|jgi:DNA-binding NarL/FixJ family response regulator|uniref:response regulator transcription factor n=1 Tax=Shinella zoogloeoides TaxID=352475 RepID=UPI00273EEF66|nr:response regulator transcription factor [Shinella zoogloeoides]WLR94972.1 response regulator transcription factor [Shinella zoogloeoides]
MTSTQINTGGTKLSDHRFKDISAVNGRSLPIGFSPREKSVMILDRRALDGQCLARCLASQKVEMEFIAVTSTENWKSLKDDVSPLAAILLNIGGESAGDPSVAEKVRALSMEFGVPVILLADSVDLLQIMKALEFGARGYIPSSVTIDVCIEAIALSLAGGVFLPASSVLAMRQVLVTETPPLRPLDSMFTTRQIEVVNALRRGKANKIIAYELNLRESTVKVHIRNIMKKMKATNRTEVAYKLNELFPLDA